MKLIFAGTSEFAAVSLEALFAADFELALVLAPPDRPAGRGLRLRPSAVKVLAGRRGLPLAQPPNLRDPAILEQLRGTGAAAMVVAAYGLILPATVLAIPARGCLNVHASLLPRWRGAAPIERALLAGDRETGITIMQMDAGLDTGAILLQEKIAITSDDTAQTLHDRLAQLGASSIVRALREQLPPRAQDDSAATYAEKISKAEAVIDWSKSGADICRQIRAFNPRPGAATTLNGEPLKIWCAHTVSGGAGIPGTIGEAGVQGMVVATGGDAICITKLQKAGGKPLAAAAFLAGTTVAPGTRLGA